MRSYVSLVSTADYLEGVLVLGHSLRKTRAQYPLTALVVSSVDASVDTALAANSIGIMRVDPLPNPSGDYFTHWNHTYSKLHIFGLTQFEKLVYLDADMVACANLDELFERPHLSAVNAGGRLPEHPNWVDLNSGLLVVEPGREDFAAMRRAIGTLPVKDHGDQRFLHCYHPDWPQRSELHLDQRFNLFQVHLDRYAALFGYRLTDGTEFARAASADPTLVAVIHYIGPRKPWHSDYPCCSTCVDGNTCGDGSLQHRANQLWRELRSELETATRS